MVTKTRRSRRPPRPGSLKDLDPLRILGQIGLLQVAYYTSALILVIFTALTAGYHMHPDLFLDWHRLRGDVTEGWMFGLCWLLNSAVTSIYLLLFIARSKLVPDFAITIHILHLVAVSLYARAIPTNLFWWLVQIASAALMTFLGIWSCQRRELSKPISFGGNGETAQKKAKDGAGNYEMVPVAG